MSTTYERKYFFDVVRANLFRGNLSQAQVEGMTLLLDEWEAHFPYKPVSHLAYTLATVYHETAQTMQPVREFGQGRGYRYGKPVGKYNQVYYGRGHVQLTWETNYLKATQKIKPYGFDEDLHRYPDRALVPKISAAILMDGMGDGWFTGTRLSDYFSLGGEDPIGARRIVNGRDKAELIASYHWKFKDALQPIEPEPLGPPVGPQMTEPLQSDSDLSFGDDVGSS
jgi:putative chitinase